MRIRIVREDWPGYPNESKFGTEWVVIEIDAPRDGPATLRVYDPDGSPWILSALAVEVVSDVLPSNWRFRTNGDEGDLYVGPRAWSPYMWDPFFNGDRRAHAAYEQELPIILAESSELHA